MQYRRLGRTELKVAEVGMGTWKSFDVRGEDAVSRVCRLFERAVALGVNLFDTAPMYGEAESVLGTALQGRREGIVVATKVLMGDRGAAGRQIEESFRRLRVDVIDLMQIHNMSAWEEVAPLLQEYKTAGRIRYLGITDYRESMFPEMMRAMRTGVFDAIQIPYNLAQREAEREILPLAGKLDMGVLVMTPICPIFRRDCLLRALSRVELSFLRPHGIETAAQALLKYVLARPEVSTAIPATSRLEHAEENASAGDGPALPEAERRRLEAAWRA